MGGLQWQNQSHGGALGAAGGSWQNLQDESRSKAKMQAKGKNEY